MPGKSLVLGVAATLVSALPAWSAETFDFVGEAGLEPSLADTPNIIEALMFTFIMYFTIILLWVWVSSFADEATPGNSDNQELPPGFDRYLHASIRSYNDPAERAAAIKDQVYNAHNMDELKHGMALQASEFLQQQIRDCASQVRAKVLLAKRLSGSASLDEDLGRILGGSGSRPIDKFIDDCILNMDLGKYSEQVLTRKVMRRVAAKLAMDEVARCLEGVRSQSATLQQHQHGDPLLAGGSRLW